MREREHSRRYPTFEGILHKHEKINERLGDKL